MVLGVILIAIVILILVGFVLFSLNPDLKSQITVGNISANALSSFDNKVSNFKKGILDAAEAKQRNEFVLSLSEDEINSKIVQMLAEGSAPFKDLKISLQGNLLRAYLALKSSEFNAKMGFVAKPEVVKGQVNVRLTEFQLGKLPLHESAYKRTEDILNILINAQSPINDLPVEIKSIEISNNSLVLKVISKPAG